MSGSAAMPRGNDVDLASHLKRLSRHQRESFLAALRLIFEVIPACLRHFECNQREEDDELSDSTTKPMRPNQKIDGLLGLSRQDLCTLLGFNPDVGKQDIRRYLQAVRKFERHYQNLRKNADQASPVSPLGKTIEVPLKYVPLTKEETIHVRNSGTLYGVVTSQPSENVVAVELKIPVPKNDGPANKRRRVVIDYSQLKESDGKHSVCVVKGSEGHILEDRVRLIRISMPIPTSLKARQPREPTDGEYLSALLHAMLLWDVFGNIAPAVMSHWSDVATTEQAQVRWEELSANVEEFINDHDPTHSWISSLFSDLEEWSTSSSVPKGAPNVHSRTFGVCLPRCTLELIIRKANENEDELEGHMWENGPELDVYA